jgi:hypothetical protein
LKKAPPPRIKKSENKKPEKKEGYKKVFPLLGPSMWVPEASDDIKAMHGITI